MSKDNSGPAFPRTVQHYNEYLEGLDGMSLRDWFAGQALPSVIGLIGIPTDEPDELWNETIAKQAYALADAMLAERNK